MAHSAMYKNDDFFSFRITPYPVMSDILITHTQRLNFKSVFVFVGVHMVFLSWKWREFGIGLFLKKHVERDKSIQAPP
jgi:hypothetical protein